MYVYVHALDKRDRQYLFTRYFRNRLRAKKAQHQQHTLHTDNEDIVNRRRLERKTEVDTLARVLIQNMRKQYTVHMYTSVCNC